MMCSRMLLNLVPGWHCDSLIIYKSINFHLSTAKYIILCSMGLFYGHLYSWIEDGSPKSEDNNISSSRLG